MAETYDAIIIGGGTMGWSTTLQLARRGMEVALLEEESLVPDRLESLRPYFSPLKKPGFLPDFMPAIRLQKPGF